MPDRSHWDPRTKPKGKPPSSKKAQPAEVDWQTPPEGIPVSYWQKILENPKNQEAIKWLKDPRATGQHPQGGWGSKQEYIDWLRDQAAQQYDALPQGQKDLYTKADAEGSAFDPLSPEGRLAEKEAREVAAREQTEADFQGWTDEEFADFENAVKAAATGDQEALATLQKALGEINDPELAAYVGDYVSQAAQAYASPEAIAAQKAQLDKLNALSDPTITAEERLMMEIARREQEQDLRAQRGAIANDLQARGVYGSGQELTMGLLAQQEGANRKALEYMQAQANAQERAMKALEGATDLATTIRDTEFSEAESRGTAADKAAEFNREMRQKYEEWKVNEIRKNNESKEGRVQTIFDAVTGVNQNNVQNHQAVASTKLQGTIAQGGAREGMVAQIGGTTGSQANLAHVDEEEAKF